MADKVPSLDDLLKSIQEEDKPQSSSALAVVPKKPEDLVEEDIDPQILSILGLEEVFDLTYEEYASLLKEAAVKGRMSGSQMTTESVELVTDEFKRVKNKTGRFKVKSKKIDINKVLNRTQPTPPGAIVKAQKLIPTAPEVSPEQEKKPVVDTENLQEDLIDGIGNILESLITIRTLMQSQSKTEKKAAEEDRKETDKKKKSEREKTLEKKRPQFPMLKSLTKPIDNFFDVIKRFFKNVLLGSVVLAIFKWLKNPANQKAIDGFTNFLQNNAGLILGGLLAIASLPIATTLFGMTNTVLGVIATLISVGNLIRSRLNQLKPSQIPQEPVPKTPAPSQMQGGSNTGLFYGKNVDPKTGRQLRSGPSISRYNESSARIIQGKANIGDKLRVGFRDTTYGARNFLDRANLKLSSSWEFVKNKFSPAISNKIKSFAPKLRGLGFGAFRALGSILRLIGLGFLVAELQQDWNNKDYYAIIVKLAAYGAGWIVTSLGFLTSAALVSTGLGSPAGIALSVASMAAGAGTDAAIRHFLLKDRKKNQSTPAVQPATPKTTDYVSPFAGARDREALKASKITGNAPITIGEKAGYSASRGRVHPGRDIAAPSGTGLQVPSDSVITDKGVDSGYGNYVVFKDSNGIEHLYGHMIEPSPYSKGDNVSAGTVIGRVGSTGRSTGPHLHWEVSRVMGEVGRPRQNVIDPIEMGFPAQAPFTGKVEAAQISQGRPSIPSIPSPTGRSNIVPLSIPIGGGQQTAQSNSAPLQSPVPRFSSEDPNNMTTMVVKAIYNVVG